VQRVSEHHEFVACVFCMHVCTLHLYALQPF
jgi:hypothetical protein